MNSEPITLERIVKCYDEICSPCIQIMPKQECYNPNYHLHNIKLPFKSCLVGGAGCGKTNFLCNLIHLFSQGERATFGSIHIYTQNINEPLYEWLAQNSNGSIRVINGVQPLPTFDDCKFNRLVVFDNLGPELSKHPDTLQYWVEARMRNISLVYISHTYYEIPRLIRDGCFYILFLFQLSGKREANLISSMFGLSVTKLLELYTEATKEKLPLTIVMNAPPEERFRAGLKCLRSV